MDVQVGGDLSLAVFPSPHVKIEDLVVAAPLKKNFENLLSMKSVEVSVEMIPLFSKEIKVKSVTLISPDIQIEIMQDGRPSWTTSKLDTAKEVANVAEDAVQENPNEKNVANPKSKFMDSVALDRLEIENGKLNITNYPNPFNPVTNIIFELPKDSNVLLEIFNIKGQKVISLVNETYEAGSHTVIWNTSDQSSGVYLMRFDSNDGLEMKKLILLK